MEFIKGKWYVSSHWGSIKAAKFLKIRNCFHYSEKIEKSSGGYVKREDYTETDNQDWSSFREVPISEIKHLLPKEYQFEEELQEFPLFIY